jgi:hypothetical protein
MAMIGSVVPLLTKQWTKEEGTTGKKSVKGRKTEMSYVK